MTQLQAQKIGDALEKIANELQRLNDAVSLLNGKPLEIKQGINKDFINEDFLKDQWVIVPCAVE